MTNVKISGDLHGFRVNHPRIFMCGDFHHRHWTVLCLTSIFRICLCRSLEAAGYYSNLMLARKIFHLVIVLLLLCTIGMSAFGQGAATTKDFTYHEQSWLSFNSTLRFSDHWGLMADFHMLRENFGARDNFYFVRFGAVTWIAKKYPVAYGVAHLWKAPVEGNVTWSDENRIFEQWSADYRQGIVSGLHRIRLEQRWRDVIVNDVKTGEKQFSVRLRYLAGFDFSVFKNEKLPSLVLSDEILVQFGQDIIYNTFDQNRFFIGLKLPLAHNLSCDIGYMNILQQRATGYQYDMSDVFRLFLYYSPDFRKNRNEKDKVYENTE
jgi:hypothetical protein